MPFRVLIAGGRHFTDYPALRAALDTLLANRLPDVSCSSPGAVFLEEMAVLAAAIEACFLPLKLNYELLGNQVPHLHWHIFPRSITDPDRRRPVWFALEEAEADPLCAPTGNRHRTANRGASPAYPGVAYGLHRVPGV